MIFAGYSNYGVVGRENVLQSAQSSIEQLVLLLLGPTLCLPEVDKELEGEGETSKARALNEASSASDIVPLILFQVREIPGSPPA